MGKKVRFLTIVVCCLLLVGGCKSKDGKVGVGGNKKPAGPNEVTKDLGYKVSDCITLGSYKGVEVPDDPNKVSDEEVEAAIQQELSSNATPKQIKKGKVKKGDTVNIHFVGKKDGKEFDGGTGTNNLTIGSNSFIPGFEDKLIGVKVGETKDLKLTFPKDYNAKELAGKDVVFTVTVNYICGDSVTPKLDKDYVTSNTNFKTVEEYKEALKENLRQEKINKVWALVVQKSKVKKLPEKEEKAALEDIIKFYKQYASSYGMKYEDFLKSTGMTEETMKSYSKQQVAEKLVFYAIVEAENMTLSADEFEKGKNSLMKRYNVTDSDKFVKDFGKESLEKEILLSNVKEFVIKNAKVVTTPTATASPAAK